MDVDQLCINTIRTLSIDAIQTANSGHPGLPLGAAPMAYTLWTRHMKHDPTDPKWPDRDRFVLSGGHGSMLLYSLLHLTGYDVSLDDLRSFRQLHSKTPGHPEYGDTPGIETTTGPLGQGFATAVGMAIAEAHLAATYNKPDHQIVDHFTYVLASDGDMMEGVASEAASLAGHLRLGKLICLYDSNDISLAGTTDLCFSEDVAARFRSYGWSVREVADGNDVAALDVAIAAARSETASPSLIVVKTVIGCGSPNKANSSDAHGSPLGKDEVAATKRNLGMPDDRAFFVPDEVRAGFANVVAKGRAAHAGGSKTFDAWAQTSAELAIQWADAISGRLPEGWDRDIPEFGTADAAATRATAGKVLNAIAPNYPALVGGSADLNPSTNTALKGLGDFEPADLPRSGEGAVGGIWGYAGRNVHWGVREHAMAAAANGMALHGGVRPFVATFFNFADYLKPSLRLAALMELPVIYVFTHDSIALGEDGPTHQPIEQLAALRSTPNVVTLRPADANEVAEAWKIACRRTDGPVALVLSRQKLPNFDRTVCAPATGVQKGAYTLMEASGGTPSVVLIATGSEVSPAVEARQLLESSGTPTRVVSMPSWELFDAQSAHYRASVLPPTARKVAIEAASPLGWHKYVGSDGEVVAMTGFGASAPAEQLLDIFGFTASQIAARAAGS
ncbi:MAG: transketolase [Armatimonadetes bacterium]|nr:transketolase [Armatimonadota bacterium]